MKAIARATSEGKATVGFWICMFSIQVQALDELNQAEFEPNNTRLHP